MKKLFCTLLAIVVVNFLIIGNCFSQDIIDKSKAELVLNDYFSCLRAGNTTRILNLLTGPFLKRRERLLLYNPEYGAFLREKYKYGRFSITGHRFTDNRKLTLEVQIVLNDQVNRRIRFVFVEDMGQLKIYSEKDIPMSNQADGNS